MLFCLLAAAGCQRSGTWTDDPANYRRAFGADPPPGVEVEHSWYWRSPHFTREEALLFAMTAPPAFVEGWVAANEMVRFELDELGQYSQQPCIFEEWPPWFAPEPLDTYEIWRCPRARECLAVIDLSHRRLFLYACQL